MVKTLKKFGGKLERHASFESIQQVIEEFKDVDIVVNCTGLGSYYLKDVQDHTMYPIRGQTVVVRAPHVKVVYTLFFKICECYTKLKLYPIEIDTALY